MQTCTDTPACSSGCGQLW